MIEKLNTPGGHILVLFLLVLVGALTKAAAIDADGSLLKMAVPTLFYLMIPRRTDGQ